MFEGFEKTRIDVNGVNIHLRYAGSGPPVLLLHGYPQTHVEWHKVAPVLKEHFTVVCPDLRGYGDSDKPPSDDADFSTFCKRTTAADQVAVMRALGFDSFHLVGHDRGVRVGLRMALDHPDAVRSFVNLDVVPSQDSFEAMDAQLAFSWFHWHLMRQPAPFPETLIGANPQYYLDFLLDSWTSVEGAVTPDAYAEYLRCFCNPDTIRATCADYRGVSLDLEHDAADRGKKLHCPVLVLWGGVMPKRPGWQTGGSLDMLDVWRKRAHDVIGKQMHCGHFIPEERPQELVDEITAFVRRHEGSL
jgi:haloacetate dehalogenase